MKKFILVIASLLTVCLTSFAQVTPEQVNIVNDSYSVVVNGDLPIATKFLNAKEWIAKTFGDYKAVLQFEDEENGKIIVKGKSPLEREIDRSYDDSPASKTLTPTMSYTITLDFKDDRFRIKFEDIHFDVEEYLVILSPIVSNHGYDYEHFIAADEFKLKGRHKEEIDELIKDITALREKGEARKKKEQRELEEKEAKLKDKQVVIEQQSFYQAKRETEVKTTIASLVVSLSTAINTSDDF